MKMTRLLNVLNQFPTLELLQYWPIMIPIRSWTSTHFLWPPKAPSSTMMIFLIFLIFASEVFKAFNIKREARGQLVAIIVILPDHEYDSFSSHKWPRVDPSIFQLLKSGFTPIAKSRIPPPDREKECFHLRFKNSPHQKASPVQCVPSRYCYPL